MTNNTVKKPGIRHDVRAVLCTSLDGGCIASTLVTPILISSKKYYFSAYSRSLSNKCIIHTSVIFM